jgi:hypothetical protein
MKSPYLFALIALLSTWSTWPSSARAAQTSLPSTSPSTLKIRNAFRSEQGDLIVRFEEDTRLFPSGNTIFYKKGNALQQIEITFASNEESSQDYSFVNGSLSLSDAQAELYCSESNTELKPLSESAKAQLVSELRSKKLSLKMLPEIQEPVYLLQVKGTDELVYVTSPRYNFHGNHNVWLISEGSGSRKKKIETLESPVQQSSDLTGLIRFKSGGGLYIPGTIDLFLPPAKHRGTPTLIRTKGGKPEELVRPNLSRQHLLKLGIKAPQNGPLMSPCNRLNDENG